MKKAILLTAMALAFTSAANAQWNGGGGCNRPVKVTVNRYNYYQPNNGWGNCGPYRGGGNPAWGYNGYGQQIPNGLGWTLFGIQTALQLFAPRPQAAYVQYPMYQSPSPIIIRQ